MSEMDPTDNEPWPPTLSVGQHVAKRAIDLLVSATVLSLAALPMLAIAALVRLTSKGPAFYAQHRVGLHGRTFWMLKFRSMVEDAEAASGPQWATANDARQTRLGRWLRRSCLDELPQFINILLGQMSLIGPRPERPHYVKQFTRDLPDYQHRHRVLPGLSGWAQIHGLRGRTSISLRLERDLFYVRNYSLLFDLKIMVLTPVHLLAGQTVKAPAYSPEESSPVPPISTSTNGPIILTIPRGSGKKPDNMVTATYVYSKSA